MYIFDRNVFVIQLELTFLPLSLQDPPFYRYTREHTTHIHTINTENTFFLSPSVRRDTLSSRTSFLSLSRRYFFFFSFRKLFSTFSHAKPSNVQLIKRLVDESCRSLLFSLTLSLRAPTITLSHRRPEQKGKSMKEKYDASARKSAFMLASWSTVLWFHFDEHMCECTCKCTSGEPKIIHVRYRRKMRSPNFVDRRRKRKRGSTYNVCNVCVCVCERADLKNRIQYTRIYVCMCMCECVEGYARLEIKALNTILRKRK